MASLMEKLGSAFEQASTGVWGLGLLTYAAAGAIYASLFVGEFGALSNTGFFGLHLFLVGSIGAILCAMALLKIMGLARGADQEPDVGQQTQDTADQIRQMVKDAVDNATKQSQQPQPDMSAFEKRMKGMEDLIKNLRDNMGKYTGGTPGAGAVNTNTDAMANLLAQILARLGNLGNLNGQTTPTPQQTGDFQVMLELLRQLIGKADDTNKNLKEMRDTINNELLGMLKDNFEKIDQQFERLRGGLGKIVGRISAQIRETKLSIEEKTDLVRTEMAWVKEYLEKTLPEMLSTIEARTASLITDEHATTTTAVKKAVKEAADSLKAVVDAYQKVTGERISAAIVKINAVHDKVDQIPTSEEIDEKLRAQEELLLREMGNVKKVADGTAKELEKVSKDVGEIKTDVAEIKRQINEEVLRLLRRQYEDMTTGFKKVNRGLGTATAKIIDEVRKGTVITKKQHELTRKELGESLNLMEDNLRTTITTMKNSMTKFIKEEHASMTKELKDELRKNFGDLDDLILAVESQQERKLTDLHSSLASLTKTVDRINIRTEKIPGLEQSQSQLMGLISSVGSQVSTANKALIELHVAVGDIKEMLIALKEQVSQVREDVANIDTTLSDAVKKLIDLSGQVTTFEKKSEEWNREVKRSVESVGGALDALTEDLKKFWKGPKGGMITMGRVLQRFKDMGGFIRRLEKQMKVTGLDVKGIDAHLQAFDEILEGLARGVQLSDEQVPDDDVKIGVADIEVNTAMIGMNIAVLVELLTQKVGAVTAQKVAEITVAELEEKFTATRLKTFYGLLYALLARLRGGMENHNVAEINKPIILKALESIRKNYLSSLNETIAFMKKYDTLFIRYMKQSAEITPGKRKPVEYREMIKAYKNLEKAMQDTLNALERSKGSKYKGAIDILEVVISKKKEDYGDLIKKQFADAYPKVEEAIKNFRLWRQYQADFRQKVVALHKNLSERARETYRAARPKPAQKPLLIHPPTVDEVKEFGRKY